jgi:hypothetical protein
LPAGSGESSVRLPGSKKDDFRLAISLSIFANQIERGKQTAKAKKGDSQCDLNGN